MSTQTQIEHPKEEPTWKEYAPGEWYYESGDRLYGGVFAMSSPLIHGAASEDGRVEGARLFDCPFPLPDAEHGKRLIEEQVAAWRAEGVLV